MRALIVSALLLALCACHTTEYRYSPPASKKGQACIARCGDKQQACRVDETQRADASNAQCQRDAEVEYTSCLKYASDRNKCIRSGCYDYAHTSQCDEDYRVCYQNCGGKIEMIEH